MQKQQLIWNTEPAVEIEIHQCRKTPARPAQDGRTQPGYDKIRFILPTLPRRKCCVTKRAMLAALREAELAQWEATGGDFLHAMHQPVD
jgi:hypothetical protein